MDETAGFTSPKYNVSAVGVVAAPVGGLSSGQDAVAIGTPGSEASTASSPSLGHGFLQPESLSSISIIGALWAVRIYFMFIMLSYARFVLRQHIARASHANVQLHTGSKDSGMSENPFARHTPEGQGWRGRLGRAMVAVGKGYWLGVDDDDSTRGVVYGGGKFRRVATTEQDIPGVIERERRRRSGTGPPAPAPPLQVQPGQAQHLRVQELQNNP